MSDAGMRRPSLMRLLSGPNAIDVKALRTRADLAGAKVQHEFGPVAGKILKRLKSQLRSWGDGGAEAHLLQGFCCSLRDIQTSSAIACNWQVERLVGLLLRSLSSSGAFNSRLLALVELQLNTVAALLHVPMQEDELQLLCREFSSGWALLADDSRATH